MKKSKKNKKDNSSFFMRTLSSFGMFFTLFILLSINLLAVSLSLQCNRDKNLFFKIASSIFAFMFGIFYILVNFYYFKLYKNNSICDICDTNIFSLF